MYSDWVDLNTTFGTPPEPIGRLTDLDADVFSEEFTLNSRGTGRWHWSVGAFYRKATDHTYQFRANRIFNGALAPIDFTDTSESFAVFGETTLQLLDGLLELTGGLRYFEDRVALTENQSSFNTPGP